MVWDYFEQEDTRMTIESKSIFASKTFWINAITLVIGIVTLISGQTWIPENVAMFLTAAVLPVLNIALRFFSDNKQVTVLPKKM